MRWLVVSIAFLFVACGESGDSGDSGAGSSIEIEHITVGTGASPDVSDTISVHYHGTFLSGTVFDSSVVRGTPAVFPLDRVIQCWQEALPMMRVGGTANIVCPPETAYGEEGTPGIPPNTTLYFEVELLAIL
jgi:FKBP-type peptidyl-prolyl cis-trans isomerase FkpA